MKKTTFLNIPLKFLFILLFSTSLAAQGALVKISLDDQVKNTESIIEGKVIAQEAFWNREHGNIFTKNTIEVYKVFKGNAANQIEVITKGGFVGTQGERVTPSLQFKRNDVGVFFLYKSKVKLEGDESNLVKYNPYSGPQGFYKYNLYSNNVSNVFQSFDGIESDFYSNITSKTKISFKEIVKKSFLTEKKSNNTNKSFKAIAVTGTSPSTISAGTKSVLTITGIDFGAVMGTVHFQDADEVSGQIQALDSQIISWTNTEVQVEVPSDAGTGSIQVEDDGGTKSAFSGLAIITVPYAELNFNQSGVDYQSQHVDRNASGGYTWQMNLGFNANTAAKESFLRAFETWRCETGVNWDLGSTTFTSAITRDGINVVRFDLGTELEDGILGVCYTYPSVCTENGTIILVDELDIVFDDGTDWEFGPALAVGSKYDFETVAVHELGHGHQLGHVISPGVIMHRSIASGQNNRALSADDITGGNDVQSRSTTIDVGCGEALMTNHSCSLSVEEEELNNAISLYPNPAKNQFFIKNTSFINLQKAVIYDISGRLISEHDISNTSRTKTIDVLGASKGIYFVNIHSENGMITKKIILD